MGIDLADIFGWAVDGHIEVVTSTVLVTTPRPGSTGHRRARSRSGNGPIDSLCHDDGGLGLRADEAADMEVEVLARAPKTPRTAIAPTTQVIRRQRMHLSSDS